MKKQLKRIQKKKKKLERLLIKFLIVGQERESTLEDLAHANWVEVDLLDRNHPDPISKLNKHPEMRCQIDLVKLMVNHIVGYVIES